MLDLLADRRFKVLVFLFALYQAGHLGTNALYFAGSIEFPPPPASGVWEPQIRPWFDAIAAADSVVSVLSLVFAAGCFRRRSWSLWVGLVAMTASVYSSAVFGYACSLSGTWETHVGSQILIYLTYLPAYVLYGWMCVSFHRGLAAREDGKAA
ncbi:MAG: hypothetical protein HY720_24625 [Planctomycetes bacterium]|nr:hypothetical protein [Planctomycetota bacterium]